MKNLNREEELANALDDEGLLAPLLGLTVADVADKRRVVCATQNPPGNSAEKPYDPHREMVEQMVGTEVSEEEYLDLQFFL